MLAFPLPLVLALTAPADAFAPQDGPRVDLEPQRIWWRHPAEQARLTRGSAALAAFRAAHGDGWQVAWDEVTRTPRYVWGPGIPVPTRDRDQLVAAVRALVVGSHELLGFDPGQLALVGAAHHEPSDTWYVDFRVEREPGVPTWRGGVSVRIRHGRVVLVSVSTDPSAPVTGAWSVSADEATTRAIAHGPAPSAIHTERSVARTLLDRDGATGSELRRAWEVRTRTQDPPGRWVSFVDAETGELLSVHNEVRFLDGTVTGVHHERVLDGSPLIEDPLPLVFVHGGGGTVDLTGDDGAFTVNAGALTTDFAGDWLTVVRLDGADSTLTSAGPDLRWTSSVADQTEIDSYVYLHQVRNWGLSVDPTVRMMEVDLVSNVNMNQACNAYYDGTSVNFFRAKGACNNTGQIADIEYHEWGHGFHWYSIQAPNGFFDGSLSEGAADTVAFLMTGDNRIGPTFLVNGAPVRNVEPDKVYPDDYVDDDYFVHENGLIFGGSIWDLLQILKTEEGDVQGQHDTEQIFAGILRGGTDIPGTFYEALVADDDDGNLSNGTPHQCEIVEAFGRHGLANGDGLGLAAVHEPEPFQPADTKVGLPFELQGSECFSGVASRASLHYRKRGNAEWKDGDVEVDGSDIVGHVPPYPSGTIIEYWLDGVDADGISFVTPPNGQDAPFTYRTGGVLEVGCQDFEADDGGYTTNVVLGTEDAWSWATPAGANGDPAGGYSGSKAWSLDPGGAAGDGFYPNTTSSKLRSADLDTYHYTGVFLQYRRWLQVESGQWDVAWIEADGKRMWSNSEEGDHRDWQWIPHVVDLEGRADRTSEFNVAFGLESDGAGQYGGWNIDDVCLMAPDTLENRLGASHLEAIDVEGHVGLSWVDPRHEPASRLVIVRRDDRFPESHDDGKVILDTTDLALGEERQHLDPTAPGRKYYAIFVTDGTDWTSEVTEGVNAVEIWTAGVPGGDMVFGNGDPLPEGCGCAQVGAGQGASALVLAAGFLGARRRRRC